MLIWNYCENYLKLPSDQLQHRHKRCNTNRFTLLFPSWNQAWQIKNLTYVDASNDSPQASCFFKLTIKCPHTHLGVSMATANDLFFWAFLLLDRVVSAQLLQSTSTTNCLHCKQFMMFWVCLRRYCSGWNIFREIRRSLRNWLGQPR